MYKSSLNRIYVFLHRVNAHSRPTNGLFISLEIGFPKRIVYVIIRYVQFESMYEWDKVYLYSTNRWLGHKMSDGRVGVWLYFITIDC